MEKQRAEENVNEFDSIYKTKRIKKIHDGDETQRKTVMKRVNICRGSNSTVPLTGEEEILKFKRNVQLFQILC